MSDERGGRSLAGPPKIGTVARPGVQAGSRQFALLLIPVLAVQICLAGVAITRNQGRWLQGDNFLYEHPAWNLASGHGLSFATSDWEDPYLTSHFRAEHPEAAGDIYIPSTTFPPGYTLFLAGIYVVVGHSHLAAVVANAVLLAVTLPLIYLLAIRAFGPTREAGVVLLLVASYPMWAYWSAMIMSDILHVFLITLFGVVWFVDRPSTWRSMLAGIVLGLACLTRPFSALLPAAFLVWGLVSRLEAFTWRPVAILALAAALVGGTWTARNYNRFGTLIPVTSMGLGERIFLAATFSHAPTLDETMEAERVAGIGDIHRHDENLKAMRAGVEAIKRHPVRYLRDCLLRLPRRWVTLNSRRDTIPSALFAPFVAYQIVLLVIMIVGAVSLLRTRNAVLSGSLVMVLYYTLAFFPFHTEARYLLPARAFGFLLSAPAIIHVVMWARRRGPGGGADQAASRVAESPIETPARSRAAP